MATRLPGCQAHFSRAFDRSQVISGGSTAIVERLPCGHVRKSPYPDSSPHERHVSLKDIKREYDVYMRIVSPGIVNQAHFLEMVEFSAEQGIILQGMPEGTLRNYLKSQGALVSESQRLLWAYSISTALQTLHTAKVIHGDLRTENILLNARKALYLIDFSGSSIEGKQGSAWEDVRFFMPRNKDSDSTIQTDLFALGSTLYEIFTSTQPYHDLTDDKVEALFRKGEFPSLDLVPCGKVIRDCWKGRLHSVDDVVTALEDELHSQ